MGYVNYQIDFIQYQRNVFAKAQTEQAILNTGFSKDQLDSVLVRNALGFSGVPLSYEQVICLGKFFSQADRSLCQQGLPLAQTDLSDVSQQNRPIAQTQLLPENSRRWRGAKEFGVHTIINGNHIFSCPGQELSSGIIINKYDACCEEFQPEPESFAS